MEKFEIHITGSENILEELSKLQIKSIEIDLLKPDKSVLRRQHMSSTVQEFKNLSDATKWTESLSAMLETKGVQIIRKKIESPIYEHYLSTALYMETHWRTSGWGSQVLSEIVHSGKMIATDRLYRIRDTELIKAFLKRHSLRQIELCLYDTFISEDYDWFNLYRA